MLRIVTTAIIKNKINVTARIRGAIVQVIQGLPYFQIVIDSATLAANQLDVAFHFNPSPQPVDVIELWVNGSVVDTRLGNSESPFSIAGVTGSADVQIKVYKNSVLIQVSDLVKLPVPTAPPINLFTFNAVETINLSSYFSDPQGLFVELDSIGIPNYGTVELQTGNSIKWTKDNAGDVIGSSVTYTIKNSAGVTATNVLNLDWEEIALAITSPAPAAELIVDEANIVKFTATPATQTKISAIGLIVNGVEIEKRNPYGTSDFTIPANVLSLGAATIQVVAYDLNDVVVAQSAVVNVVGVPSSIFANGLITYSNAYAGGSYNAINNAQKVTISIFSNINIDNNRGFGVYFNSAGGGTPYAYFYTDGGFLYWKSRFNAGSLFYLKYDISGLSNGVHSFIASYDHTKATTALGRCILKIDGGDKSWTVVDESNTGNPFAYGLGNNLTIQGSNNTLQSQLAIDIGHIITTPESALVWNNGKGSYYKDVVKTPTSYFTMDGQDSDSSLIDSVGGYNLSFNNFFDGKFVDFVNYAPTGIDLTKGIATNGIDSYLSSENTYDALSGISKYTISFFFLLNADSDAFNVGTTKDLSKRTNILGEETRISQLVYKDSTHRLNFNSGYSELRQGINCMMFTFDALTAAPLKNYLNGIEQTMFISLFDTVDKTINDLLKVFIGRLQGKNYFQKSILTQMTIHAGYKGNLSDAIALYNRGLGADYRDVVNANPTSHYTFQEVKNDGANYIPDEMGYNKLRLTNIPSPYLVDFKNYVP